MVDAKDAKTLPNYTSSTKSPATPPSKIVLDSLIPKETPKPPTSSMTETKAKPEVVLSTKEPDLLKKLDLPTADHLNHPAKQAKPPTKPLIEEVRPPRIQPLDAQQQQQQEPVCTCTSTTEHGSSLVLEFALPHTAGPDSLHLDVSSTVVRLLDLSDNVLCAQTLSKTVVPDSAQAKWSKKTRVLTVSCILAPVSP